MCLTFVDRARARNRGLVALVPATMPAVARRSLRVFSPRSVYLGVTPAVFSNPSQRRQVLSGLAEVPRVALFTVCGVVDLDHHAQLSGSMDESADLTWQTLLQSTRDLAERCSFALPRRAPQLPEVLGWQGGYPGEHLAKLARQGLDRLGLGDMAAYVERLSSELAVIEQTGTNNAFLLVHDAVQVALRHGIALGPGRGAACNSLVCHALGITAVDPLQHRLDFEHLLLPADRRLPNLGLDVSLARRDELVDHLRERWGHDRVALVKGEMPTSENASTNAAMRPDRTLLRVAQACGTWPELTQLVPTDPTCIAIGRGPLVDQVPLRRSANGNLMTQFAKPDLGLCGVATLDLLGDARLDERLTPPAPRQLADCFAEAVMALADGHRHRRQPGGPNPLDLEWSQDFAHTHGVALFVDDIAASMARHTGLSLARSVSLCRSLRTGSLARGFACQKVMMERMVARGLEPVRAGRLAVALGDAARVACLKGPYVAQALKFSIPVSSAS